MKEKRPRPQPAFPWWYDPASGAVCAGCVSIPALSFPLAIIVAISVSAGAGLYLGYHQGRTDLPQGIGSGRRRIVGLAFVVLFLTLMARAVVTRVAELPRALAATLVFTAFVLGMLYPRAWRAAGQDTSC